MSFSDEVNDFVVKVDQENEQIIKGTVIALYGDIIKASPVDTGRFRANWFLSNYDPSGRVTENTDKGGEATTQKMQTGVLSAIDFSVFTLTNNLPYSEVIEFGKYSTGNIRETTSKVTFSGFSKQAPKGVVRANTVRFESLLEKQAKKENYGGI